jgi:hypothetical protein
VKSRRAGRVCGTSARRQTPETCRAKKRKETSINHICCIKLVSFIVMVKIQGHTTLKNSVRLHKGVQFFPKPRSNLKILGATRVTQGKCHAEGPQIFGASAQKFRPVYLAPCAYPNTNIRAHTGVFLKIWRSGREHLAVRCCSIHLN